MAGIDDDPGKAGGIEKALLLVEVPASRLLGQEPALEPVREPRDDIGKPAHLLVEIGAEAPQFLLVAQFLGLDDLVEAGREGLVVGRRREVPVAPSRRREQAFAKIVTGSRLLVAGLHLLGRIAFCILILGFFAAHLDVAAPRLPFLPLLGGIVASALIALGFLAALLRLVLGRFLGRGEV